MKETKEKVKERLKLINILIGHNLAKTRVSAGMSADQLGKIIGVSEPQILKYEKGENAVPPGRLVMIAETFEVDLSSLFNCTQITKIRKDLCIYASRDFTEIKDEYEQNTIRKIIKEALDNQK